MRMNIASRVKIAALDNRPYLVTGEVLVTDAVSNESRSERKTRSLCRCGGSTTKSFCNSTHSKIGFKAAQRTVQAVLVRGSEFGPSG